MPPPHRPESSRLLGLLVAMAVLALVARWLQPDDAAPRGERALSVVPAPPKRLDASTAAPTPLRLTDVRGEERSTPALGSSSDARLRPVSAALCHALDEKLKALGVRANDGLDRTAQRVLRTERRRALDMQATLRCRPGGERYWF